MSVSIADLPDKLPDTESIKDAAGDIGTAGTHAATYADDGVTSWAGLEAHYSAPESEQALSSVQIVKVYADEASTCSESIKTALETYAEAISGIEAEYKAVKEEAATHNAVDTSVEDFDKSKHNSAATALQGRIDAVATTYDESSKTCADSIRKANTGKLFEVNSGGEPAWIATYLTSKALEGYTTKGHTKYFTYTFSNPKIVKPEVLDKLPIPPRFSRRLDDWVEAGNNAINKAHRKLLPDITKNQFVKNASSFDPATNPRFTALMASPGFRKLLGTDGKTKNPSLRRLLERHHLSVKDGKITVGYAATDGKTKGTPKVPGWVGKTLKGVNIGSNVLGYADKTSKQYEELRTQHPDWSQEQLMAEAAVDGAIEQGGEMVGEAVGGKVGQVVGRAGGAALGQVLIPIPGVGAAVGGVVGGFLGEMAGSWLGGKAGGWLGGVVADNLDVTEGLKDMGGAVSEGVDKAKDFVGGLFG